MINTEAELYKEYLYKKLKKGGTLETEDIEDLKGKCQEELDSVKAYWERYKNREIPIYKKKIINALKSNSTISFDYRAEIVDQLVDYLLGDAVGLGYEEDEEINDFINNFSKYVDMSMLDIETLRHLEATGRACRMLYINEEGSEDAVNLHPWSVITLDNRRGVGEFGFRFYTELDEEGDETEVVEFYDASTVKTFKGDGLDLVSDDTHQFGYMPIINAYNDDEREPGFAKVEQLIDAINEIVSNHQDEIAEFRNAYMVFRGARLDEKDYEKIIKTGAFEIPEDTDVEFLTKHMDVNAVNTQRQMLIDNMYKLTKSVDIEKFSDSSESGESRKWKLINLESKAKEKVIIMSRFLKQMFKVLSSATAIRGKEFFAHNVDIQFYRSLPVDEKYIGEYLNLYANFVSHRTILEQIPFGPSEETEMERLREDQKENLRKDILNNTMTKDGHPVTNVNNEIKQAQAQQDAKTGESSDM